MNASLSFAFFLIAVDHLYDIDEDVGLCDGYLFAGFGLMTAQKIIPQWTVLCIGLSLCLLKNVLQLSKSNGGASHIEDVDEGSLAAEKRETARTVAVMSYFASVSFFFGSTFYASLHMAKLLIPVIVLVIGIILLLPLPRLNLQERLPKNIYLYAFYKSAGSFGCNYIFDWIGSSIKVETDTFLMNASLSFVFFLIVVDYVYDIDEDVELCDGYLFAGFGLMTAQKVIPQSVVLCTGSTICFIKNYLQLSRKALKSSGSQSSRGDIESKGSNIELQKRSMEQRNHGVEDTSSTQTGRESSVKSHVAEGTSITQIGGEGSVTSQLARQFVKLSSEKSKGVGAIIDTSK